ncbi:MAG TPA: hypothetical protein VK681_36060 [Reyranella sp.]|jgi:hypothetical protein|nr:hypothetical protein [Reyranella sp.]
MRVFAILALALVLAAALLSAAQAQTAAELKARCSQLISYYDRFGVGRSNNSDGRRNHTRIEAEIDCASGLYAEGISTMEGLLRRKKFAPPAPGPNEPEDDD